MNIENLNIEEIGIWPWSVKIAAILSAFILMLGLGFWFDTQGQLKKLKKSQQYELKLKKSFEKKHGLAANLEAYQSQLEEIKETFGALLKQLPEKTEVPNLLEDISKAGLSNGLRFDLFKPLSEQKKEFYAVLPVKISVLGSYHSLGAFVSDVAALSRIVTFHDFKIAPQKKDRGPVALLMEITAKTYRYRERD